MAASGRGGDGFDVVTGAFGHTGAAVARELLARGRTVRTFTRAPPRPGAIAVVGQVGMPHDRLVAALEGCDVLYSTHWARFGIDGSFEPLVQQGRALYAAARDAGVRRIVQVTVACIEQALDIPYYAGKAQLEAALRDCGVGASAVRPAFTIGPDDTLLNNAAWTMRRLHAIPVPASGRFAIRPALVDDVARLMVAEGEHAGLRTVDAVGPETMTYREILERTRDAMGVRAAIVGTPRPAVWLGAKLMAPIVRDTLLTWPEIVSMREGVFAPAGPTTCPGSVRAWITAHGPALGQRYRSQRRRAAGRAYPD